MGRCSKCWRPAWKPGAGMGGEIPPDREDNCLREGTRDCRMIAAGVAAERDRCAGAIRRAQNGPFPYQSRRMLDEVLAVVLDGGRGDLLWDSRDGTEPIRAVPPPPLGTILGTAKTKGPKPE